MLDLKRFMNKTGVTKKKYVDIWIDNKLIPGAVRDTDNNTYSFPDSALRPYQCSALKAGIGAEKKRVHIVKAALLEQHITAEACYESPGAFKTMINDLVSAGLIQRRTEDGIEYYDSTTKSAAYKNKNIKEIRSFVHECLKAISEGAVKGFTNK